MYPLSVTPGSGHCRFSLFVPIWFGDIHPLRGFESDVVDIPGKSVSVRTDDDRIIVRVHEFDTNTDAESCYEEIRVAVLRAVAGRRVSAEVAPLGEIERMHGPLVDGLERAVYKPWPPRTPETDGYVWRVFSYVLPEHERILLMPSASYEVVRTINPAMLTDWFKSKGKPQKGSLSDKEQLAFEIIAEANSQHSVKLEFLGLVNALEVLIEDKTLTRVQQDFVGRWKGEVESAAITAEEMKEKSRADELREIGGGLGHINDSIRNGIRRVLDGVPALAVLDPQINVGFKVIGDLPRAVKEIYNVRSQLTHDGRVHDVKNGKIGSERLRDAASLARYVVYCVLFDRLK
jgi:hypothetical protein